MDIEEAIYDRLTNWPGMADYVADRIYPAIQAPPSPSMPYVVYQRISTITLSSMVADDGLERGRWQFDVIAEDYDQARAVKRLVIAALRRWRRSSDPQVQDSFKQNEMDGFEDRRDVGKLTVDFEIIYAE